MFHLVPSKNVSFALVVNIQEQLSRLHKYNLLHNHIKEKSYSSWTHPKESLNE